MKKLSILLAFTLSIFLVRAQEIIRGPYLQSMSPNSIKIIWRTDVPAIGAVEFAAANDVSAIISVTKDTLLTDHIILIENLEPATTYKYRIKTDDDNYLTEWADNYRFSTTDTETDQLSFWVTGDFGSKSQKQIDVRKAFENYVDPTYPDFWLWLGDNAYDDGTDDEFQERVFTKPYGYDSLLTFLPFYPVPGNHDYRSVNLFAPPPAHKGPYFDIVEVPTNGEAGGKPSNTELYYSFDYGNAHFAAINSEAFAYTFFRNSVMEQWLREDMKNSDKPWKIVYWHQPPYSKGSHDSDEFYEIFMKAMRDNYSRAVEQLGVDLVLCGHSHVYERSHLIKGHYGKSGSFKPEMFVDNENPYVKYVDGDSAGFGTIYAVVGNSGKSESDAPGGHPIFAATDYGSDAIGSLLVSIDGNKLKGEYIRGDGTIADEFTIVKALQDSSVITTNVEAYLETFTVFPNPAKELLNIQFSLKQATKLNFHIMGTDGKMYVSDEGNPYSSGSFTKQFNLNQLNLPTGTFVVKIGSAEGEPFWVQETLVKIE